MLDRGEAGIEAKSWVDVGIGMGSEVDSVERDATVSVL